MSNISSLVTKHAPDFVAEAVMYDNTINKEFCFSEYVKGHSAVLFFYPLDFTFVCPTELIAFNKMLGEFEARNTKVIAVSVDSVYTHVAYKATPISGGGIGQVKYPMVSDIKKHISNAYGVLFNESVSLRGTFIIDKNRIVQAAIVQNLPLGRNVEEVIRLVDSMHHVEAHGEVCPANWHKGAEAMYATHDSVKQYNIKHSQ